MKDIILYAILSILVVLCIWQCGPSIDKQLDFQERVYSRERAKG